MLDNEIDNAIPVPISVPESIAKIVANALEKELVYLAEAFETINPSDLTKLGSLKELSTLIRNDSEVSLMATFLCDYFVSVTGPRAFKYNCLAPFIYQLLHYIYLRNKYLECCNSVVKYVSECLGFLNTLSLIYNDKLMTPPTLAQLMLECTNIEEYVNDRAHKVLTNKEIEVFECTYKLFTSVFPKPSDKDTKLAMKES